jgi:hypothetical protein
MIPGPGGTGEVIHANTVPISDLTLDLELEWAADNYVAYFYMGSGYEPAQSTRPTTGASSGGRARSGAPIRSCTGVCVGGILGSTL